MTAVRAAAASLAVLLTATPVFAQTQQGCPAAEAKPARKPALGGLFAAARDAGLGQALVGSLGQSGDGQIAGAVAGAALSGDAAGVVAAVPAASRNPRTAQLAGALTGMAMGMAQSARAAKAEACGQAPALAAETPSTSTDVWR